MCILGFLTVFLKKDTEETILWSEAQRITWEDFKGQPDNDTDAAAITASGLSYDLSASIGKRGKVDVVCTVSAYFYPYESWFKQQYADGNILSHERLHFDITELMARKFRKRIEEGEFTKNVKMEVKQIYKEVNASLDSLQNAYDLETHFSIDKEKQLLWQIKVAKELEATKKYKR